MRIWINTFVATASLLASAAAATLNVSIDSSAVAGSLVRVAIDVTTSTPSPFSCFSDCVSILNFSAPGSTMQLPETIGGLVTGDLILLSNPAALTYIDKGSAYNNVTVNLGPVGNSISFQLDYTDAGPAVGDLPDQIAIFLLDSNYLPLFPTSDPLGVSSLLTIDLTGATGGLLNVYSPAAWSSPTNVSVTIPGDQIVPEPETFSLSLVALGAAGVYSVRRTTARRRAQL